jgi:hypothetical protein
MDRVEEPNPEEIDIHDVHLDGSPSLLSIDDLQRVSPQSPAIIRSRKSNFTTTIIDNEDPDDLEFPEECYAHITVLGSFLGIIPAFGIFNSVGAIEAYIYASAF